MNMLETTPHELNIKAFALSLKPGMKVMVRRDITVATKGYIDANGVNHKPENCSAGSRTKVSGLIVTLVEKHSASSHPSVWWRVKVPPNIPMMASNCKYWSPEYFELNSTPKEKCKCLKKYRD